MRLVFTGYTGDKSDLRKQDLDCLKPSEDLWVDIPMSRTKNDKRHTHVPGATNLRDLMIDTYPGATHLHHFATESVKATGKYPVSSIVRTAAEDLEEDVEEEFFEFDPLDDKPEERHILKRPSKSKKPTVPKPTVGQFQPRPTLKNTIKGRSMPKRACVRSCRLVADGTSTTYDVIDVTPKEGVVNNKVGWEPKNV